LQSERVKLSDLALALNELEPTCAALAAQRVDRIDTLVPDLQQINAAMVKQLNDVASFTELGRQFHDLIVQGCGNRTMIAMVGCLEELWTAHEKDWAEQSAATGEYPSINERKAVLRAHKALTDAISSGDSHRARRVAARHLVDTQAYVLAGKTSERIVATVPHTHSGAPAAGRNTAGRPSTASRRILATVEQRL
jgi:DNA-binding FadR family transcriptional regulator